MEGAQRSAIVVYVDKVVASLEALSGALNAPSSRANASEDVHGKVKAVEDEAKQLHSAIEEMNSQRVLMLSSDQLMEAGIVLYNASRSTFKRFQAKMKQEDNAADASGARFPILFVRFMAARVVGLALSCSTSGQDEVGSVSRDQSVLIDDCLDVLRSYGRVGSLLLETAAIDSEKCFEYLTLSKDALDNASVIWARVGLSCLTRFKEAIELEEILQDLWDFNVDRVRAVRLLQAFASDKSAVNKIIETLHELQMLLPYMLGNSKELLELIQGLVSEWSQQKRHEDLVALAEEALRLCDAMENAQEDGMLEDSYVPLFKRRFLVCLLDSLGALGDVAKAEACFTLLGSVKESPALLTMLRLYLQLQLNDKAATVLKYLFQRDDVVSSITGARLFVEANSLSEDSITVYRQLERHYGDHVLEIGLDLACCLAGSESQRHRAQAVAELRRLGEVMANSANAKPDSVRNLSIRIRQTIHDAAQVALSATSDECVMWAELGMELAQNSEESALFKRLVAAAYLKMGRPNESWKWAEDALRTDSSKASLFSLFEAGLGIEDLDNGTVDGIIRQLRDRDDFNPQDLVAYGYAAHTVGRQETCLTIMDELCGFFDDGQTIIEGLPVGLLLQNTAQLALATATAKKTASGDSGAPPSFARSLLKYADIFLQAAERVNSATIDEFGPTEAFLWFYAMSFNVARSCSDGALFIRAADIASLAERHFGMDCPIANRELECLLAALSTEMAAFESCGRAQLEDMLGVIARINSHTLEDREQNDFVGKCELVVRLRLYDPDVEAMRKLCQDKILRNADNCIDLGELILHAAQYDEANTVRKSYRALASDMFKLSLQQLLQGDTIEEDKLSYLLRRLITLAENRSTAFEWLDQLVQLAASVDLSFPDLEAEWFISKAWNTGVQQHRCQSFEEAQKFMKVALTLLASIGPSLTDLSSDLHQQYQSISAFGDIQKPNAG